MRDYENVEERIDHYQRRKLKSLGWVSTVYRCAEQHTSVFVKFSCESFRREV